MKKYISIGLLLITLFFIIKRFSIDIFLPINGKCIKALVTSKTFSRRWHRDELLYEFHVNGEDYTVNSAIDIDSSHKDSICVVYLEIMPSVNMRYSYFIERNREMNCKCQ